MKIKESNYFVHQSAYVDKGAYVGNGTQIWYFSHVMKGARIGNSCKIGQNVFIGKNVTIGNNVKIQNNVSIYTGVTLEDDVFCGPSCVFTNIINPRSAYPQDKEELFLKTLVRRGASIGANATIICGVTLGLNCFIGAGAVVTKDIPDYALAYGNPARIRDWMCECGIKLEFRNKIACCKKCKSKYFRKKNLVSKLDNQK